MHQNYYTTNTETRIMFVIKQHIFISIFESTSFIALYGNSDADILANLTLCYSLFLFVEVVLALISDFDSLIIDQTRSSDLRTAKKRRNFYSLMTKYFIKTNHSDITGTILDAVLDDELPSKYR